MTHPYIPALFSALALAQLLCGFSRAGLHAPAQASTIYSEQRFGKGVMIANPLGMRG